MNTKKSNIAQFIPKTQRKSGSPNYHVPEEFAERVIYHPDASIAANLVAQQTALTFDHDNKSKIQQMKVEQDELNHAYQSSRVLHDDLVKKKANTKPIVKSTDKEQEVPFKQWKMKDKVIIIFLMPLLLIAMYMGAANLYANLMASGTVIFIEKPELALALSTLLPIGGVSLKFISNFIEVDLYRRRYALSVFVLTFIALMIWTVLFAMNFNGIAGEIDYENFGESNGTGSWLVWSQLLLELLMTSALALAIEDIYFKYSPDHWDKNKEYVALEKAIKSHLKKHRKIRRKRNKVHAQLIELEALKQKEINAEVARYVNLRAQHQANQQSSYNL